MDGWRCSVVFATIESIGNTGNFWKDLATLESGTRERLFCPRKSCPYIAAPSGKVIVLTMPPPSSVLVLAVSALHTQMRSGADAPPPATDAPPPAAAAGDPGGVGPRRTRTNAMTASKGVVSRRVAEGARPPGIGASEAPSSTIKPARHQGIAWVKEPWEENVVCGNGKLEECRWTVRLRI